MEGPYKIDQNRVSDSSIEPLWERDCMKRGVRYRVIRAFKDGEGDEHPVDEEWLVLGSSYSIYDNMHVLHVSFRPHEVWLFPLFTDPERQREIVDNFHAYVQPVPGQSGANVSVDPSGIANSKPLMG